MQVETPIPSSSSPLTSLVSSSNPSIDPARQLVARAKVTYSRKPIVHEDHDPSSSSQPTSPSDNLFDSPMRSYGRNTSAREGTNAVDHDANDITITTDISPATTAHAANSAIKGASSSLFRRVDSYPSQHSDNDEENHDSSTHSPVVNRTKKFQFGVAKAIFDSDSDSDTDNARTTAASGVHGKATDDDDAVIARIRAQAAKTLTRTLSPALCPRRLHRARKPTRPFNPRRQTRMRIWKTTITTAASP